MLVMVNGAGPGLGKSTLARALVTELRARDLSVELFAEEDILWRPEFAPVIEEFRTRPRVELATLLAATSAYLDNCRLQGRDVYVLDGLIPYWLSVAAWAYSDSEVAGFLSAIADIAEDLDPVEIYLDGDVAAGVMRAAAREGGGWIESQIAKVGSFQQVTCPPQDLSGLAVYYRGVAEWAAGFRKSLGWPVRVCAADLGPQSVLACALAALDAEPG